MFIRTPRNAREHFASGVRFRFPSASAIQSWTLAILMGVVVGGCNQPDADKEKAPKPEEVAGETPNENANSAPVAASPSESPKPVEHGIRLTDYTEQSQIDFVHHYDGKGEMYIVEPVASGMASLDIDLDGRIDLYFLNGAPVPFDLPQTQPNAFYRNLGNMQFANATEPTRTGQRTYSTGVAVSDFDGDGFPDIFVNNFGPNTLYRNNGDGTFTDVTAVASVGCGEELGAGACFLDADGDGLLDLYVGNYVKQPVETNIKRTTDGFPSYPGPLDFEADIDFFFRNEGDGTFSDQSEASGIAQVATTSMGSIAGDFDDDGDTDLIVVNDVERNLLFLNDGTGKFEEIGILSGIAFSNDAQRNGNMGIDAADFNQDGAIDLYTTTFSNDLPVLYRNDGFGNFEDVTLATGTGKGLLPHANWGTAFFDAENDGDKDLIVANGHTDPNVSKWAYTTAWKVANTMYLNEGGGRFSDVSKTSGSGLSPVESSRGLVVEDFDNDGDTDVVVLNALAAPTIIRNETHPVGNWLQLELHGRRACRDAVGTKISFEIQDRKYVDEVRSGRGYQSSYGQRLCFGLGEATSIELLTIRWPDGTTQELPNVAANQIVTIIQDTSSP